ncbi:MAG: cyclic nucleotide-binding domain-containing protein [Gammaproteobacteria bacterium]|nr:cyclic nucleotide-binding domain-containing protein [Gammaproteobacteria bacterium]
MTGQRRSTFSSRDRADCQHCAQGARCWPGADWDEGPQPALRESAVRAGDFLWRSGDAFTGLVIVHSGCVMLYRVSPAGEEQVLLFALPGDLIGLEALASGRHALYARALGEVLCCRIPCAAGLNTSPHLQRRLLLRASNILARHLSGTRHEDPTGSVLEFLRDIAQRLGHEENTAGLRSVQLRLPMSRLDIGRYLGFAEETVCRAIRRLEDQGLITVRGRQINLLEAQRRAS